MKRFYGFALIFIALFSCLVFSACGNKYKNLKMTFVDETNEAINEINLIIDNESEEPKNEMRLGVKFSGIKIGEVGNVDISCEQGLVSNAKDIDFKSNTYNFTISAIKSGVGTLKVTHLASKKTATINLNVEQKSHNLITNEQKYIIAIPEETEKPLKLNLKQNITLQPIGSTDTIWYGWDESNALVPNQYLRVDYTNVNGNTVIENLTVLPTMPDGTEILVYPVATMEGYDNDVYRDKKITIVFKKVLNDENLAVTTDEFHKDYLNDTIYLIANDSSSNGVDDDLYEYRYLRVLLKHILADDDMENLSNKNSNGTSFLDFYEYQFSTSNPNISCALENDNVIIFALDATLKAVDVSISLVPKNCIGEIAPVSKHLSVKGELKPTTVSISMRGNELIPSLSYDLLDYYANSPAGALFKFSPVISQSYGELKQMRLIVNPAILNVKKDGEGLSNVYTDSSFTELVTNFSRFGNVRTNIYLLDLFISRESRPIRFYYNEQDKNFYSELIDESTNVYIKYEENSNAMDNNTLSISVATTYTGNLKYLENINGCSPVTINFKNSKGVYGMDVFGGHLDMSAGGASVVNYGNKLGYDNKATDYGNTVEINRLEGVDRNNEATPNKGSYLLDVKNVVGAVGENQTIATATFNVSVSSGGLRLKQYNTLTDENGLKDKNDNYIEGADSIEFNYDSTEVYASNSILLVFDSQTNIGEYEIKFTHASGYTKTIVCHVYEKMEASDIEAGLINSISTLKEYAYDLSLPENMSNEIFDEFKATDGHYLANYVVSANKLINFEINLDSKFINSKIVNSYDFVPDVVAGDEDVAEYLSYSVRNSAIELRFLKGTIINETNRYIEIKFIVNANVYDRLEKTGTQEIYVTKTFFVFEPIEDDNIDLYTNNENTSYLTRYPFGSLGVYYNGTMENSPNYSAIKIEIKIDDNLKQYINKQQQTAFENQEQFMVVWYSNEENSFNYVNQDDYSINLQVAGSFETSERNVYVYATIKQFNRDIIKRCTIHIVQPILTEKIEILTELNVNEIKQTQYLNLQTGERKTLSINAFSSKGNLTFNNNLIMLAVGATGNIVSTNDKDNATALIYIDNANATITINNIQNAITKNINLVVFAKDVLKDDINQGLFNSLESYLMDRYKNAYMQVELLISNGTKENPFILNDAQDFWNLKTGEENKNTYYTLMSNINLNTLNSQPITINNFYGNINSYENTTYGSSGQLSEQYVYTIYGITLNKNFVNLFSNFYGSLSNINFVVNYDYNLEVDNANLGLISENYGNLTNVFASISGVANVVGKADFGALVGRNLGTITYTSGNQIGVSGNIEVLGSDEVHFGGLVGLNDFNNITIGSIFGASNKANAITLNNNFAYMPKTINSAVDFALVLNNSGAISSINVSASNLTNENSAVGGVVGLNKGNISNVYATGNIAGKNNVGGIIGKMDCSTRKLTLAFELTSPTGENYIDTISISNNSVQKSYVARNLVSSVIVKGENNVGGVVGCDLGGSYSACQYQILQGNSVAVLGQTNVGGIAGYTEYGVFEFCSVMSYRWNYANLSTTFETAKVADISGNSNVGGFVGYSKTDLNNLGQTGDYANTTTIMFSSVNALVCANENVWGLIGGSNNNCSVLFNVYFIGEIASMQNDELQGKDIKNENGLAIAADINIYYNSYSINAATIADDIVPATYGTPGNENFDATTALNEHWEQFGSLNGGFIYLVNNGQPIFEQTPTLVNVQIINGIEGQTNLLQLEFYDFELDSTNSKYREISKYLNEKYNRKRLVSKYAEDGTLIEQGLFNISTDLNSNNVRIIVESLNPSVLSVEGDYIVINDIGECSLKFYSALNPAASCEISMVVTAPVGNYLLSVNGNENGNINGTIQSISKGKGKQFYAVSNDSKQEKIDGVANGNNVSYKYKTSSDVWLKINITVETESLDEVLTSEIKNYLTISSIKPNDDGSVTLDPTTPFSIQIIRHLADAVFNFNIVPYRVIKDDIVLQETEIEPITFKVKTFQGPTGISLTMEQVNLYPNDQTTLTALILTDLELPNEDLTADNIVESIKIYNEDETLDETATEQIKDKINLFVEFSNKYVLEDENGVEFNGENNIARQKAYYTVYIDDCLTILEPKIMQINFEISQNVKSGITFKIYPQRIDSIEIRNYYFDRTLENGGDYVLNNMLRPEDEGLIVIDLAPENSYFDYLEITDITGSEEIRFTQLTAPGGTRLDRMDQIAAQGKGIKLVKTYNEYNNKIYVASFIDVRYSSKIHTIKVVAYDKDGNILKESNNFNIDIKMNPEIEMDYVDPNGVHINNGDLQNGEPIYLANGVPSSLYVNIKNTTEGPSFNFELKSNSGEVLSFSNYFGITANGGGYYTLDILEFDDNLKGATLSITASTFVTLNNGKKQDAEPYTLNFKIVEFVIHNISVNHSRVQYGSNQRILDGDYGVANILNFYFAKTDISFNDGKSYWNTDYVYSKENYEEAQKNNNYAIRAIYSILKEINTGNDFFNNNFNWNITGTNDYFISNSGNSKLIYVNAQNGEETTKETIAELKLANENDNPLNNRLILVVNEFDKNVSINLNLNFNLILKTSFSGQEIYNYNNCWLLEGDNNLTEQDNTIKEYKYSYLLNYSNSTSFLHPEIVKNEEEFLNMKNDSQTNYILANDLVFENFVPLDVHIASFDGNGRRIIIRSFAEFNDANIYMGLFKQIYSDMTVMNLEVIYDMYYNFDYQRLGYFNAENTGSNVYKEITSSNSVQYTSALFGGLAAENFGTVTNCRVYGGVAMRARAIENLSTDKSINFNMGGLIGNNYGFVTNSDSYIALAGCANIGGFVYANYGKIASCSFDASKNYKLEKEINYAQENASTLSTTHVSETGFIFAYNEIAASENTIYCTIGGFAVYNYASAQNLLIEQSEISMSYVSAGSTNKNSNINGYNSSIAGFVYSNDSNIYDCYTNIEIFSNAGDFSGFVILNSGTIRTSYTYVNKGEWTLIYNMFAPKNTTGIYDCVEIINKQSGSGSDYYDKEKKVEGVATVQPADRFDRKSYVGFAFGDNVNSVWQIFNTASNSSLPTLISTKLKIKFEITSEVLNSKNGNRYYGLRRIERKEELIEEGDTIITINTYELLDNGYGLENNPIIIYNLATWNYYFTNQNYNNRFFRVVSNINFAGETPKTSETTFSGNLQGNNMNIQNIMIFSSNNLTSIGLFKDVVATGDLSISNVVANLNLEVSSIRASGTQAVGALTGIIDGFKVYGIKIKYSSNATESGKIIVGKNAVGGLAGIIRGGFDIDGIESNVGANSASLSSGSSYSIYKSVSNREKVGSNIDNVYYAGAIAGIVDGYSNTAFDINNRRDIENGYLQIRNVRLTEGTTIIANTVGGLFGFVGEQVLIDNANVDVLTGNFEGKYYSAGLVGENRGIIQNSSFKFNSSSVDVFMRSSNVSAGLVGLNLGGLVLNCTAQVDIIKTRDNTTVGGLVGRSVNGFVKNSSFKGNLMAYFTGGIVGSQMDSVVLGAPSTAIGSLTEECRLASVIPNENLIYIIDSKPIKNLENVKLDVSTISYWQENMSSFYSYVEERYNFVAAISYSRVLGLAVGTLQTGNDNVEKGIYKTKTFIENFGYDSDKNQFVINGDKQIDKVGMVEEANLNGAVYNTPFTNIVDLPEVSGSFVMYLIGTKITDFDSWARNGYSNEMVTFTNQPVKELKLSSSKVSFSVKNEIPENPKEETTVENQEDFKFYIYFNQKNYHSLGLYDLNASYDIYTSNKLYNNIEDASGIFYSLTFDYTHIKNIPGLEGEIELKPSPEELIIQNSGNLATLTSAKLIKYQQEDPEPKVNYGLESSGKDLGYTRVGVNFFIKENLDVYYSFSIYEI